MADERKTQKYNSSSPSVSREELDELETKISALETLVKGLTETINTLAKNVNGIKIDGVPPEQILNMKAPEFKNFGPVPRDGNGNPLFPPEVMAKINAGERVEGFVAGVGPMTYKVQ